MSKPIKVAMIMGKMQGGGVESVIMNYYRNIDHKQIQFDFIVDCDSTRVPTAEIESYGGKVYFVPPYQKLFMYSKALRKVLSLENYSIIHSNINTLSVFPLRVAKKMGIPVRIAHNHSTAAHGEYKKNLFKYLLRPFSTIYPTNYLSPTYETGRWLFGNRIANTKLVILQNAIDLKAFKFNPLIRKNVRNALGIKKNTVLIGNVGRNVWQKNQEYVIDIFAEYQKQNPNSKLLIIGDGPLRKQLIKKCYYYEIMGKVIFKNNTNHIQDYYQAMDWFVFPSKYEGLGIAAVEAQYTGVKTILSDKVPCEAIINSETIRVKLGKSARYWAEKMLNNHCHRISVSINKKDTYDIVSNAKKLELYYLSFFK